MISINNKEPQIYYGSTKVKEVYKGSKKIYPTETIEYYGIQWDESVTPHVVTRIGNLEYHKTLPIQSKLRGCVVQGTTIQYYLDAEDWSKKQDGTASVLDGTDGVVKVHTPKFYGKSEEEGTIRRVYISETKIDDTWVTIPEMLIDAYRPTMISTVPDSGYLSTLQAYTLVSVVNTSTGLRGGNGSATYDSYLTTDPFRTTLGKPRTSMSRATARTRARQAGAELLNYEQYKWIFYWLYVIEYASFNCQAAFNSSLTSEGYHQGGLGSGTTGGNWNYWTYYSNNNPLIPCGYCNEFGNGTGVKQAQFTMPTESGGEQTQEYTINVPRWRGFDNPFGDIQTNIEGVVINTPVEGASDTSIMPTTYTMPDPSKYTDDLETAQQNADKTFTLPHTQNYIKEFYLGTEADIVPKEASGTSTIKYDYYWNNYDSNVKTLLVGGSFYTGSGAGLGGFRCTSSVGNSPAHVGFRTVNVLS